MALTVVAWALFQPVAPGPAVGAAITLVGLHLTGVILGRQRLSRTDGFVLTLLGAVLLATACSPDPARSLNFALKYWHFALVPAVAAIPLRTLRRFLPAFLAAGTFSSLIAGLAAVGELLTRRSLKWDLLWRRPLARDPAMVYGFFDHYMTFAGFVAVVTFACSGLALFHRDRRVRRRAGTASLGGGLLLLFLRKRTYWVSGGAGLLLLALRLRARRALVLLAVTVLVFSGAALLGRDLRERFFRIADLSDNQQRIGFWIAGWEMWKDRPLVGWGPGGYRLNGQPYLDRVFTRRAIAQGYQGNFTHVHNVYLQLLVEGGALLLGAYLVFLGYLLRRTGADWWARGAPGEAAAFGAGVFALLVTVAIAGVFEWNIMDKEVGMPIFFAAGLYLLFKQGEKDGGS